MIQLFPCTGIQFVDAGILASEADDAVQARAEFSVLRDAKGAFVRPVIASAGQHQGDDAEDPLARFGLVDAGASPQESPSAEEPRISVTAWEGFELLHDQWFNIPYNSKNPLWCRGHFHLEDDENNNRQVRVTLCYDTRICPANRNDGVSILGDEIGTQWTVRADIPQFWRHDSVIDILRILHATTRDTHTLRPRGHDDEAFAITTARVRAAIQYIARKLPAVQMFKVGASDAPVEVTLVLDLGNCRTSGVLVERAPGVEPQFCPLELRSYDLPFTKTIGVFETRFEFVTPLFSPKRGWPMTRNFRFYSLVRMGADGERAAVLSASRVDGLQSQDVSGMSSPKRYLWDARLRDVSWRFAEVDDDGGNTLIQGEFLQHLCPTEPFAPLAPNQPVLPSSPAAPRYPRKSSLVFVLYEIINQAYVQMNSHDHRRAMVNIPHSYARRRRFSKIMLIHPSGMSPVERAEFLRGAQRTVDLWHRSQSDPAGFENPAQTETGVKLPVEKPVIDVVCDEASAVQMCYLYGELEHSFVGHYDRFFNIMGKARDGRSTLRIASLDIGGGTTDFVIADYQLTAGKGAAEIEVTTRFVDGISLGGDDIVRAFLEQFIFPQICRELGLQLADWFSCFEAQGGLGWPSTGNRMWQVIRPQLVHHVWIPIVRHFWKMAERGTSASGIRMVDLFETQPPRSLIDALNKEIGRLNPAQPPDVMSVLLDFRPRDFDKVVTQILFKPLEIYADICAQFDCDLLLLAGRPSGLPVIRNLLLRLCPVGPGRIIALQGYPAEKKWFPFASRDNRIEDAKFCAVVGATLYYLANHALIGGFVMQPVATPAQPGIFGIANPHTRTIDGSQVLFGDPKARRESISFGGKQWIGARRIDFDGAPANPLYVLEWASHMHPVLQQHGLVPQNVSVVVSQDKAEPWKIIKEEVRGEINRRPILLRDIELRLQTIFEDDYWLDTGCFVNPSVRGVL